MSLSEIFCDLVLTDELFNEKPVYQCSYCGIKLVLEDPATKVTCFKRREDLLVTISSAHSKDNIIKSPIHLDGGQDMQTYMTDKIRQELIDGAKKEKENLCTEEQINNRLNICKTCEYFQNNSCLLCGCTVVRDANHQNKLAHKDQSCPANKWGPIS